MEEFTSEQEDLCFGGENVRLLRQELLDMDRDFRTPHSIPLMQKAVQLHLHGVSKVSTPITTCKRKTLLSAEPSKAASSTTSS